jgi:two-component system, response regulator
MKVSQDGNFSIGQSGGGQFQTPISQCFPWGYGQTATYSVTLSHVPQKRIVLIEDSASDALLLKLSLEGIMSNFDLTVLEDGETALNFLSAERGETDPTPCLVLLDIHLPKHDGLELLAAIRRAPPLAHVTVLAISACPSPQRRARISELGASYFEKPRTFEGYELLAEQVLRLCEPETQTDSSEPLLNQSPR